jgi:hypothetical protein
MEMSSHVVILPKKLIVPLLGQRSHHETSSVDLLFQIVHSLAVMGKLENNITKGAKQGAGVSEFR